VFALPFFFPMKELVDYLSGFLLPRRVELFDKVLSMRTKYITVALEDIYQPQNASAVLRSCDCLGIQDVHIIEENNEYRTDREVAMGSSKWLNLMRYNNQEAPTRAAIKHLKENNYRIVATCPNTNDTPLQDFDITKGKVALFFGTELTGLSQTVRDEADEFLKIPMAGFTESFNISVSAAIILHHLTMQLRNSEINWALTEKEKLAIKLSWLRRSVKRVKLIEEKFYKSSQS
jgi:tRNA (guanosine-2'-O-)-methyltransferase